MKRNILYVTEVGKAVAAVRGWKFGMQEGTMSTHLSPSSLRGTVV
jgi:hypothetical protein